MKKGWIENQKRTGSPVMVDYKVLTDLELAQLTKDPNFSHSTMHHTDLARMMAHLLRVTPEDLLAGRVVFCSQEPLRPGMHLEVITHVADFNCPLHFIAEAHDVGFEAEMKEMVFSTGMKVTAVHKGDMELLSRAIELRKNTPEKN